MTNFNPTAVINALTQKPATAEQIAADAETFEIYHTGDLKGQRLMYVIAQSLQSGDTAEGIESFLVKNAFQNQAHIEKAQVYGAIARHMERHAEHVEAYAKIDPAQVPVN